MLKSRFSPPKGLNFIAPDPVFTVGMELVSPDVNMNPNLEEIQVSINQVARAVVSATKHVYGWQNDQGERKTYFDSIGKDKHVAKTLLLLTGALLGLQLKVMNFLELFHEFNFLWEDNIDDKRNNFVACNPTLDEIEHRISDLETVGTEIDKFEASATIGSLSLSAAALLRSLQEEVTKWKLMYARLIHEREQRMLTLLASELTRASDSLQIHIEDIDDLSNAVEVIQKLRQIESDFEYRMMPIMQHQRILQEHNLAVFHQQQDVLTLEDIEAQWRQVNQQSKEAQDQIMEVQNHYKSELMQNVEGFVQRVAVFQKVYETSGPSVPALMPRVAVERLRKFKADFRELENLWRSYEHGEKLFGLPVTQYRELVAIKNELSLLSLLYDLYTDVLSVVDAYGDTLWSFLDLDSLQTQLAEFQARCKKLPKPMKEWQAYSDVKTRIDSFDEMLPLLNFMRHKSLRERHWEHITRVCGEQSLDRNVDTFRLHHVLDIKVLKHKDDVEEICIQAQKQEELETKLVKIRTEWTDQEIHFDDYRGRRDALLDAKQTTELVAVLDESQTTLLAMAGNRHNAPFKSSVQSWIQKLSTVSEIVDLWLNVQFLWQYLEAVFAGGDIAKQLPQEARRFSQIDKTWTKIMENASEQSNILKLCCGDEMLGNVLPSLLEQLEVCQRHLGGYLEGKRALFPRFYFVSDGVLLEVLGRGTDPQTVQTHLQTLFSGVKRVIFDQTGKAASKNIAALQSPDGEIIQLEHVVVPEGNVEVWLGKLEKEMQVSVNGLAEQGAIQVMEAHHLEEFVDSLPAQIAILSIQVLWTIQCEEAMLKAKAGDRNVMALNNKRVASVLKQLVLKTGTELGNLDRKKTESLITIQVHQRDIICDLYTKRIKDPYHFEWQKQMRAYWNVARNNCTVSVTDVNFVYYCEYLGCTDRDTLEISCRGSHLRATRRTPAGTCTWPDRRRRWPVSGPAGR